MRRERTDRRNGWSAGEELAGLGAGAHSYCRDDPTARGCRPALPRRRPPLERRGRAESIPVVTVSPKKLSTALRMAKLRAAQAGCRLAEVWRAGL